MCRSRQRSSVDSLPTHMGRDSWRRSEASPREVLFLESAFHYNEPVMRASSLILLVGAAVAAVPCATPAQGRVRQAAVPATSTLLVPDRVWDGVESAPHSGWAVLVTGNKIIAAGPRAQISAPAGATTINLPGTTLMPGLIDAHSHVLLHPYNETSWNDQVLHEPLAP